jgi:hypothetical protein
VASPPDDFSRIPHRAGETRRNAAALLIAAVVVAVIVFLALRPAFVLGNDSEALADSLAGELGEGGRSTGGDLSPLNHRCEAGGAVGADFECAIQTIPSGDVGSGAAHKTTNYAVEVGWLGCWDAAKVAATADAPGPSTAHGCIGLFDY